MDAQLTSDIQSIKSDSVIKLPRIRTALATQDFQLVISVFLALMAFSLPVSISLKAIFIVLASVTILVYRRHDLGQILMTPWCTAALLYFFVIVIGCYLSPADKHTQLDFIHKYSKLFYLPLLALGFQTKQSRVWAIHAFLLGMLVTLGCTFYKVLVLGLTGDAATDIFYNHIVTGYYMAFSAFLATVYALKNKGRRCLAYGILALLFSYDVLFLNQGRTGYVLFVILLVVCFMRMSWRQILVTLVLVLPMLFGAFKSSSMPEMLGITIHEAKNYQQGQLHSSLGDRLQFHHFAQQLFLRSPLVGVGTGAFSYYFSVEKPVPAWGDTLMEPHGEFWLIGAEHGLLGLLVFFLFLATLAYEMLRLKEMKIILIGLLCTFLAGCFTDGFFLLTGPGYLFIIFAAMSLGESVSLKSLKRVQKKEF